MGGRCIGGNVDIVLYVFGVGGRCIGGNVDIVLYDV